MEPREMRFSIVSQEEVINMSSIIKRDPWASLFSFPRFMEEFEDASYQRGLKIRETNKDLVVEAVVAGIPTENVDVNIEDGVLTIKAEVSEEKKEKDAESSTRYRYYYSTALSGGAWNKATAEIEHGVVKITIPKAEEAKPQKITVRAKGK
jgi:HSP20 family protein